LFVVLVDLLAAVFFAAVDLFAPIAVISICDSALRWPA
jgi:hypothetical protein